jgi:hypothetical protein
LFNALNWLGRQDSNLGLAESKSRWFALFVNAHSEKSLKFDLNPLKSLDGISECRDAHRASRHEGFTDDGGVPIGFGSSGVRVVA